MRRAFAQLAPRWPRRRSWRRRRGRRCLRLQSAEMAAATADLPSFGRRPRQLLAASPAAVQSDEQEQPDRIRCARHIITRLRPWRAGSNGSHFNSSEKALPGNSYSASQIKVTCAVPQRVERVISPNGWISLSCPTVHVYLAQVAVPAGSSIRPSKARVTQPKSVSLPPSSLRHWRMIINSLRSLKLLRRWHE